MGTFWRAPISIPSWFWLSHFLASAKHIKIPLDLDTDTPFINMKFFRVNHTELDGGRKELK